MDSKILMLLISVVFPICFTIIEASRKHKLVAYWGQNAVYNTKKERKYWEKDLAHFCKNSRYDVVILAFMHVYFDKRQKDEMPAMNFAFHCETPVSSEYPFLLRCPKIEAGIKECQKQGKKVLMSLGGATGGYGFESDAKAKEFALNIWNLLLNGKKLNKIRPFGSAVLDGVDLDIEGGSSKGYTQFVRSLRKLTEQDRSKKYIIAAAPQCPFPDHFLGPEPGKAFGDVPEMFDEIYIQFYNNYCQTGDAKQFYPNLRQWLDYSEKNNGPIIYVGVPSHEGAAFGRGYWRTPSEMRTIYQRIKDEPRFGGFMLWDASFDQNNIIAGKPYSEHIHALIGGKGPRPTEGTQTTNGPISTNGPQPTEGTQPTDKPKTTRFSSTQSVTKPGQLSCEGLANDLYPHPSDCAKYMQCNHGKQKVLLCPHGLLFNPERKYCDWAINVKC